MFARFFGILAALWVLSALFGLLEYLWPALPGPRFWKRADARTDFGYWFFTPVVTQALSRGAVILVVVALGAASGVPLDKAHLQAFVSGTGQVSRQPVALQGLEVLVLADVLGYWSHRAFHSGWLWRFHAVHHSSTRLDWLSSVRVHPVNDVGSKVVHVAGLLLLGRALGFSPGLVAGTVPFFVLYAIMLHANVGWTFGPLRYVVASPAFHRWHHTAEEEGLQKNFAGLFPWLDALFGTLHLPKGRQPMRFGLPDYPRGLLPQLAAPFRGPPPSPPIS
jgi:sterol desaturase/sphingolipid hydroxylase (fatty acid hydroxylase superfamily)